MDKILDLIKIIFMDELHLYEEDIENLRHCFFDIPIIKKDENRINRYY